MRDDNATTAIHAEHNTLSLRTLASHWWQASQLPLSEFPERSRPHCACRTLFHHGHTTLIKNNYHEIIPTKYVGSSSPVSLTHDKFTYKRKLKAHQKSWKRNTTYIQFSDSSVTPLFFSLTQSYFLPSPFSPLSRDTDKMNYSNIFLSLRNHI